MKYILSSFIFLFFIGTVIFPQNNVKCKMAVTMDDMPLVGIQSLDPDEYERVFNKLVAEIKKQNTPVTGFVNESRLYAEGKKDENKIQLLKNWINAGFDLGNHTYSHKSANVVSVDEYREEIVKGETIIKILLAEKGKKIKYFRHPFLHTGLSLENRDMIVNFIKSRGYEVAPVTIDNSEWLFAAAYGIAYNKGEKEMMKKIGGEYISYMNKKIEYYEGRSNALFGRNINHILLIHANRLNSDYYSQLCEMIRKRNYEFISVDEAMKDKAYETKDSFVKNSGISWIDRWALAAGKTKEFFADEPKCPKYVMEYANIESE